MKTVLSVLFAFIVTFSCVFAADAQSTATLSLSADTAKSNRLFDVTVCNLSGKAIHGGKLSITYDSSIAEYRGISSDIYEVDAKDNGDKIDIVFATADEEITDNSQMLCVSFKGVSEGKFTMKLSFDECIDKALCDITADAQGLEITVSGSSVSAKSIKSVKSDKSSVTNIDSSDSLKTATADSMVVNSKVDNSKAILYGVCAGVAVLLLFGLGVLFGRKDSKEDNKEDTKEE